jgi:lipopolysaccharide export system protein LptA
MKDMRDFVRSEFALKTRFLQALLTLCFGAFGMVPLAGLGVAQENAPFTVEADELLEWDQTKGTYRATGNAVARQENQQIKAMELVASYDTNSESRKITLIVATGAVEYEDGTSTARGNKLTYYIDAERYLIEGAKSLVTGPNGTMRASKSIELLSPTPDKQLLTAIGAAQYTDAEGQIVEGETINAHLDADGALDVLDATDNVKVVSVNGQVATGDAVTYNQKTSKALLTGNVEILDSGNVMRGSRAEVDFDSGISRILSDGSGKRVSGTLQP